VAKKYKVNISLTAQNDIEHIFFYIAEDSINNAKNFLLELEERIYSLDTFPERFAYIPENIFLAQVTDISITKNTVLFIKSIIIAYT